MASPPVHRKRVQHSDEPGQFHELTFSCYKCLPLLTDDRWCSILTESIDRAMQRHRYSLIAFVYMPEHVHLLVFPRDSASPVHQLLNAIKRPFSYRVKRFLTEIRSPLLQQLTVRQRPDVETFRFWQEGPGYDRNLVTLETAWAAAEYIHLNPVRRGLVESELDWPWSSARHYSGATGERNRGLPLIVRLGEMSLT
ncbi:MAG: transposase [Desulfomonile tiedjei]|nr:transposase [Desulfomonile tiedjei]